jgi:alkanesulfonate monooxygenase
MPARIIGMIGTQQEGVAVHLIKGQISRQWVIDFTRLHEQWNYDSVLVGYYASAAEGFAIALYAADNTERIKFLIAHRPGSVAPALAARQVATFDQLTQGRMALHIIAGTSDADQASEGDFLPKNDRYRRAGEYLDVMRNSGPATARSTTRASSTASRAAIPTSSRFSSPARRCSSAAPRKARWRWGQALRRVRDLRRAAQGDAGAVQDFRRRASAFGRSVGFNMSLRPIMAETEGAAWDKANALLADVERKTGAAPQPTNHSAERLLGYAARGDVHDERLWMGIARATGAPGNTSCLVGTPEQIAAAVLEYYRLGIHSFLLRGFENPQDTVAIGRDLIPLIKQGALAIDQQAEAAE